MWFGGYDAYAPQRPWDPGHKGEDLTDPGLATAGFAFPSNLHLQLRDHLPTFWPCYLVYRTGDRLGCGGKGVYVPQGPWDPGPKYGCRTDLGRPPESFSVPPNLPLQLCGHLPLFDHSVSSTEPWTSG